MFMIHVRRTPVRRTCTAYMYHSVNTLLGRSRSRLGLELQRLVYIPAQPVRIYHLLYSAGRS